MLWALLLTQLAAAKPASAYAVPVAGGFLAGPAEVGARGIVYDPSATMSDERDVLIDVGAMGSTYSYDLELDGADKVSSSSVTPVPFLGFAIPVGPVAFGGSFGAPHGRGGNGDPNGPGRYHSVRANFLVLEGQATFAVEPTEGLVLGAGIRYMRASVGSSKSMDTGALLYGVLGEDADVPLMDPFLEGEQALEGLKGSAFDYTLGARFTNPDGFSIGVGWRSSTRVPLEGRVRVVPIRDLTMVVEGPVTTDFALPAELWLSGRIPIKKTTIIPHAGWLSWGNGSRQVAHLPDLQITSESSTVVSIIESYGVDQDELLGSLSVQDTNTGLRDVWTGGLTVRYEAREDMIASAAVSYATAAFEQRFLHPGNVDWATIDLGAGIEYVITDHVSVGFGGNGILSVPREVDDSVYDLTNPSAEGTVLPNSNGRYVLGLYRGGATLILRF